MRGERARVIGQRAHVPVGARAEPAPSWFIPRGGSEAEAEAAHSEEPWLRSQLQSKARVPARGSGAAEERTSAGGGEARGRERRHEAGTRRARSSASGPAALCP